MHSTAWWILVPQPGTEPVSPAGEEQSPNHWIARNSQAQVLQCCEIMIMHFS